MHRSFVLLLFFALFSFLIVSVACGGEIIYPPADDGGGGSSSSSGAPANAADAGGDGAGDLFPVCPPDPPSVGAACASPHQGCRYVTIGGGCSAYACDGTWRNAPEGC